MTVSWRSDQDATVPARFSAPLKVLSRYSQTKISAFGLTSGDGFHCSGVSYEGGRELGLVASYSAASFAKWRHRAARDSSFSRASAASALVACSS
jgi:hypothetical protein